MKIDIFFSLGLLEGAEDFVSNRNRVGQTFQSRSKLFKFVVSEVTVPRSGRENEIIVRNWYMLAIRRIDEDAALRFIHAGNLAHDHRCIFMSSQYFADWRTHLRPREYGCRYLIKKRLKNMMVRPVNENDFDRRFSKSFCRSQTTETSSDNHHAWRVRFPLIRAIDRIEISIVHSSVSQAFEARNFRESTESWIAAGAMATTRSARRTAARMLIVGRLCEAAIDWRLTQTPYKLFFEMEVLAAIKIRRARSGSAE